MPLDAFLLPDATVSAGGWVPTGAASIHLAIDDPDGADDDNTTYAQGSSPTGDAFIVSVGPMTDAVAINSVIALVRVNNAGSGSGQEVRFGLRIGSTNYLTAYTGVSSSSYTTLSNTWTTNPATSAPWTKPQLDDVQVYVETRDTVAAIDSVRVTSARLKVSYEPIAAGITDAREIATKYLIDHRQLRDTAEVVSRLYALDRGLMEDYSVVHMAMPHPQGRGAGMKQTDRWLGQKRKHVIDPNSMTVTSTLYGRRGYLFTHVDGLESRRSSSPTEDGVMVMGTGGARVYERASHAWGPDPGSGLVVQIGHNTRPIFLNGTLLENFAGNGFAHSSAKDGSGSIGVGKVVATGTGVNGSSFTAEAGPPEPYFDPSVSNYAYKWVAGTPHTTDQVATWPTTPSYTANSKVRVWFYYSNGGTGNGSRLRWRLQRGVDGLYWNDGTSTWAAGPIDNIVALSATRIQFLSKRIDVGSNATTLTFSALQTGGIGTDGRIDRLYHLQGEENYWATSPVVTDASLYSRAIQKFKIAHSNAQPVLRNAGFTLLIDITWIWDAADMIAYGGFPRIFDQTYDSNNYWRAYWNSGGGGHLDFECKVAGSLVVATFLLSPVKGASDTLAFRATTAAGELWWPGVGLAPRTNSVFVNGVKGTDVVRSGDPTETSTDCYIGTDSVGNAVNASIRRLRISQEIYTDEEIARGIA